MLLKFRLHILLRWEFDRWILRHKLYNFTFSGENREQHLNILKIYKFLQLSSLLHHYVTWSFITSLWHNRWIFTKNLQQYLAKLKWTDCIVHSAVFNYNGNPFPVRHRTMLHDKHDQCKSLHSYDEYSSN